MKLFAAFTLLFSFLTAFDVTVKNTQVANGATALLLLDKEAGVQYEFVLFDKKKFDIFVSPVNAERYYVLLPVSYYDNPGSKTAKVYYLNAAGQEKFKPVELKIVKGDYTKETITVSSKKVNPKADAVKKRITHEYQEAMKIYTTVSKRSYLDKKFILLIPLVQIAILTPILQHLSVRFHQQLKYHMEY